jgi:predicted small lipoprotein YifL
MIAGSVRRIIVHFLFMKKPAMLVLLASAVVVSLSGCAAPGPSPEEQTRELDRQREAERQQADFRKSLPPVTNPGQGQ